MRFRSWIAFALLLAACDGESVADAGVATDAGMLVEVDAGTAPEDFDGYIEWWMQQGGIPGAAVAIVRPDAIERVATYGWADIESERPVDANTLFVMASVSKTVAAVRAMQLVEAGMLDLDAPVDDVLGYPVRNPAFADDPISARMLFAHVSGLEDDFLTLGEVTYVGDPVMTLAEFTMAYATPGGSLWDPIANWGTSAPGQGDAYSNAGFGVLGDVIERAGGASYRDQTRTAIFEPIDMDGAGWFLSDIDLARLATPYTGNRHFSPLDQNGYAFYPASSLRISITGLGRYARMFLGRGTLDGTTVLSEASVDEILRIQYPSVDRTQGICFYERSVDGHRYIGHSGSTFGGATQFLLSRDLGHAIILITNGDAYIRSRVLGDESGTEAMEAILTRLDQEALAP
ncbi:MAG: serine hydrolase domain-containing protein [Sandaracinaceae bacterium]